MSDAPPPTANPKYAWHEVSPAARRKRAAAERLAAQGIEADLARRLERSSLATVAVSSEALAEQI